MTRAAPLVPFGRPLSPSLVPSVLVLPDLVLCHAVLAPAHVLSPSPSEFVVEYPASPSWVVLGQEAEVGLGLSGELGGQQQLVYALDPWECRS